MATDNRIPNRLINERSPYLLQHAYNPVDWYPWGNEAFEKAKREDKPIFLSVGYSTCHWCHVMERESFEDQDVADVMNKNFVSIKVDREERPDIDSIYMEICQAMTGSGGWPLTVIITPDKKPFFAGTYFPKTRMYGRAGLIDILNEIAKAWKSKKDDLNKSAGDIVNIINNKKVRTEELDASSVDRAFCGFEQIYDETYGGFGSAPKFPAPHNLLFLLRYGTLRNNKKAIDMAGSTLKAMYNGGIFDHIGYGFSRYSTDRMWLIPHFEKMLYDNAMLAYVYTEAYSATKDVEYMKIAENIFEYLLREMVSTEGGFYSAEDADSEGIEGKYYTWEPEEIISILGEDDGNQFCSIYGITDKGNFEHKSIPNLINKGNRLVFSKQQEAKIEEMRKILLSHRDKRVHPYKDDKILTSWNGLAIAALSYAGRVFDDIKLIKSAINAADFILSEMIDNKGRLLSRYREGDAAYKGYLDDYSYLVWGLIELYEAVFDNKYLETAIKLNDDMIRLFEDIEGGGFYLYGNDSEKMISRPKESYDGALPSGNSAASMNLLRLSRLCSDEKLMVHAQKLFEAFSYNINNAPEYHAFMMNAYLYSMMPSFDIVIAGNQDDKTVSEMLKIINSRYLPYSTVLINNNDEELKNTIPGMAGKEKKNGDVTAYICRGFSCSRPVNDIESFRAELGK